jgi:serine/threonine protein kinase
MTREYQNFDSIRALTRQILDEWSQGGTPNAALALEEHPELLLDKDAVIDLAYEEILRRRQDGEKIDTDEYLEHFPYASSLRRLLNVDEFMAENAERLDGIPHLLMPESGESLDVYRMIRVLGEGAFARVYLAAETSTGDRPVVVKVSRQASREPHTLGQLPHPGIIPILSAREDALTGFQILCMPWWGCATLQQVSEQLFRAGPHSRPLSGQEILDAIEGCGEAEDPVPLEQVAGLDLAGVSYEEGIFRLGGRLAETLQFLHEHKVVHHDLKPANILLTASGAPLLLDFNLSGHEDTLAHQVGGTVPWLAPEQLETWLNQTPAARETAAAADIYSLGVILYELLTGHHPLGPIPTELRSQELGWLLLERAREVGFLPVRDRNPEVDAVRANWIDRCLALDPKARPTARELVEAFCPRPVVVPATPEEHPEGAQAALSRPRGRGWSFWLLVPALAVGVCLGGWYASRPRVLPTEEQLVAAIEGAQQRLQQGEDAGTRERLRQAGQDLDEHIRRLQGADKFLRQDRFLFLRGRVHVLLREYRSAAEAFSEAQVVARERFPLFLGATVVGLGGEAAAWVKWALVVAPDSDGTREAYLAWPLTAQAYHTEAIAVAKKARDLGFQSPGLANNEGFAALKRRDLESAARLLEEARKLKPDEPAILFNRGQLALNNWVQSSAELLKIRLSGVDPGPRVQARPYAPLPVQAVDEIERTVELVETTPGRQTPSLYLLAARLHVIRYLELDPSSPRVQPLPSEDPRKHLEQAREYIQRAWRAGEKEATLLNDGILGTLFNQDEIRRLLGPRNRAEGLDPRVLELMDPGRRGGD